MTSPFHTVLAGLMRHRGVTGSLVVDERDGVVVDSTLQFGMRGNVFAALIASLYRKARESAAAAGFGEMSFLTLDAERGRVCAVGREGLVLIAVADLRANLGLLRVELMKARESLA
jgi:predicted regulator of Ras-like GTPase activity (Roadblock/LC7/MglB family)